MRGAVGLHLLRAAGLVPFGPRLALGEQLGLQLRHQLGVLAMGGDHHAQFPGQLQRVIQRRVLDAEGALVRQEHLEGGHAVRHQLAQGLLGALVPACHADVEGVVAGAVSGGHLRPGVPAAAQLVASGGGQHLDKGGGAADQRGLAGRGVGVLGKRSHERQMDMHVRVDKAGEDVLAARVDGFAALRRYQVLADQRDGLTLDQHVCPVLLFCRDDLAVLDEQGHSSFLAGCLTDG